MPGLKLGECLDLKAAHLWIGHEFIICPTTLIMIFSITTPMDLEMLYKFLLLMKISTKSTNIYIILIGDLYIDSGKNIHQLIKNKTYKIYKCI